MTLTRPLYPLVLLATVTAGCRPAERADLVLRNTAVYTMASPDRAEAIAIRNGRIMFVGRNVDADRLVGDSTEVIDLGGRMVMPAFRDTHVHPGSGITLTECVLEDVATATAIVDSVKSCAANLGAGEWVRGRGWALPIFPGGNPGKDLLDRISPDRPVYLTAADGHSAWVNSKALALAGVTAATKDPVNGRIERDAAGAPSGTLRENAMDLVSRHLPPYTLEQRKAGLVRAIRMANEFGITTLHDASSGPELLEAYAALDREGGLTARAIVAQYVDPEKDQSQVDSLVAWRDRFKGTTYYRPSAAKFFADGVIESGTAALLAPYLGGTNTGVANFRQGQLDSLMTGVDRAGIQIHVHAIGDRGIRMALDGIEATRRANGPRDARPIISHIQLFDPADIPRFKALGVIASFQPLWAFADKYITELTEPVLGPERSRWLYPIGSLVKSGATVVGGSDWSVSSMNPLEAIQVAITRRGPTDSAGPAWIPDEVVGLTTMLQAYTVNAAYAAGDEATAGTLEVGKVADLIVLDRDLYAIPPAEISRAKVLLTLLDGKSVHRSRALQ
ncbi:MAG: amidohydrolase [Gemmatimonadales bacterium]|nr:amidohydrolase [Gemmatimonadales bacterium]